MSVQATGRRKLISSEEQSLIEALLGLDESALVKSGLQRFCDLLESGHFARDASRISALLTSLIWAPSIEVRRWTYKAIALLGDRARHLEPLIARIRNGDADPENSTWALAALFAISTADDIERLSEQGLVPREGAAVLASHLYGHLSASLPVPSKIDVERADPLTLRWTCLLVGYDRASAHLFHPRFDNGTLVAALNDHGDPIVSEYSVWALHHNSAFGFPNLTFAQHAIGSKPENVRRWVARLLSRDAVVLAQNLDLAKEMTLDPSAKAREGLAIGLRPLFVTGLDDIVLDWHSKEQSRYVKELLLEHMAAHATRSVDYWDHVVEIYRDTKTSTILKNRLEAAAVRTDLYVELQRLKATRDDPVSRLFEQPARIIVTQKFDSGGGPLTIGSNVGQGTVNSSGHTLVQNAQGLSSEQHELLKRLLALSDQLPPQDRSELKKAVEDLATDEKKAPGRLLGTLTRIKDTMTVGGDLASSAASLIEAVKSLFG